MQALLETVQLLAVTVPLSSRMPGPAKPAAHYPFQLQSEGAGRGIPRRDIRLEAAMADCFEGLRNFRSESPEPRGRAFRGFGECFKSAQILKRPTPRQKMVENGT